MAGGNARAIGGVMGGDMRDHDAMVKGDAMG
jgi:hypothetical protein